MFDKLIYVLAVLTLILFIFNIFYKGNTVQSCLLFMLALLPLMDLKITNETWGGFKTFDAIYFYAFIFLFKDFVTVDLRNKNNIYVFLFICLSITMLLSGLLSEFPNPTYFNIIKIFPIFIFGRFFITECLKDPSFHLKAINALKISYVTALGFLFIQTIVGLKFTFYPDLNPNTIDPVFHMVRYPGMFYDSQGSGQYLAMGSFLFLFIESNSKQKSYVLNYLVFLLAIYGISLAGSRAAFGGFVMGILVLLFLGGRKYRVYGSIALVLGLVGYLIIAPQSSVFDRSKNISSDFQFRESIWKETIKISDEHPILGIGWGNYRSYTTRHVQDQYLEFADGEIVYFGEPESGYLKILVELGYVGFLTFALFILIPLVKGVKSSFTNDHDKRITFLIAPLIVWMVAFSTVYTIFDSRILIMVISMIALIITYPTKRDCQHELD